MPEDAIKDKRELDEKISKLKDFFKFASFRQVSHGLGKSTRQSRK